MVTLARVAARALAGEPVLTLLSPAGWIGAAAGLAIALVLDLERHHGAPLAAARAAE